MSGDDLPSTCGSCRWLPLGYCREGIDRLRSSIQNEKPTHRSLSDSTFVTRRMSRGQM
ncbi:MAG: hypothetical protein P0121_09670 [Nitrospira sp.]|nr:hypothetical protein [Nitrospira sp.]